MRVVGKHRNSKVEGPRVVGFGLMIAGSMALVLSVAGAAGAGSNHVAEPAHHQCGTIYKDDGPMAQVLQWQGKKDCQENTSTTYKQHCGCSTTTEAVTSTSLEVVGSTVASTTESTTTPTTEATTIPPPNGFVGSTTTASTLPTDDTVPNDVVTQGGVSTTTLVPGGDTPPTPGQQITVSPETATLPLTGSNTVPLAGAGIVMVAAGFGLSRRKRSFSN